MNDAIKLSSSRVNFRTWLSLLTVAILAALATPAQAETMAIYANTTLTRDVLGSVIFGASNVTLNCDHHAIPTMSQCCSLTFAKPKARTPHFDELPGQFLPRPLLKRMA